MLTTPVLSGTADVGFGVAANAVAQTPAAHRATTASALRLGIIRRFFPRRLRPN
jgi:hypothetical protein